MALIIPRMCIKADLRKRNEINGLFNSLLSECFHSGVSSTLILIIRGSQPAWIEWITWILMLCDSSCLSGLPCCSQLYGRSWFHSTHLILVVDMYDASNYWWRSCLNKHSSTVQVNTQGRSEQPKNQVNHTNRGSLKARRGARASDQRYAERKQGFEPHPLLLCLLA